MSKRQAEKVRGVKKNYIIQLDKAYHYFVFLNVYQHSHTL